jgi:serine phosphatase RsbU (regulator of sigma subunit)/PAS domain-containing protein
MRRAGRLIQIAALGTWVGIGVIVAVAVVDTLVTSVAILSMLVIGPLVTAGLSPPRPTLAVGALAVAVAFVMGAVDGIFLTNRHWLGMLTVSIGSATAVWLSWLRTNRERQLRVVAPALDEAARVINSMRVARVGTWHWDRRDDRVSWDGDLEALFGLAPGSFEGTYDAWVGRLDPRDRPVVEASIRALVERRQPIRFDHRCVHPDGSIHWLEGSADVVMEGDEVVGAQGLAMDIDQRVAALEERNRLLQYERRERARADYLAAVNAAIADQLDLHEVLRRVAGAVVPDLADWCSFVIVADRPREQPLIVYEHADPEMVRAARELLEEHPFDPDARFGAAEVIRTGVVEFVPDIPAEFVRAADGALDRFEPRSAVTAPLSGPLGIIGSIQLLRTGDRRFVEDEVDTVVELADRVGVVVSNAVAFARQDRLRTMLDLLQRLNGRFAVSSTRQEIVDVAATSEWSSVGFSEASIHLFESEGRLVDARSGTLAPAWLEEATSTAPVIQSPEVLLPLDIMHRRFGVLRLQRPSGQPIAAEEAAALASLASRIAGALERASLYELQRDNAAMLQRRLLPVLPEPPEWLAVAAEYRPTPGGMVGGDWYQVIDLDDGRVAAVVGDAVGHGLHAAAAMGQLRAAIAGAASGDPDPAHVLDAAEHFARTAEDTMSATFAYLLLGQEPVVRYACAGHLPPVWVRPGQPARLLDEGRRPLLGYGGPADSQVVTATAPFERGDTILMFTDGLIERRVRTLDKGLALLTATMEELAEAPPEEICAAVIDRLTHDQDIEDDVAVMVVRRR